MEYVVGQKVLCVNVKRWDFIVSKIDDITPTGIIKLSCGLRFNSKDGFPSGYKSYTKKWIVPYGSDIDYAWRLLPEGDALADTLYNLKLVAYEREQEHKKQLAKKEFILTYKE